MENISPQFLHLSAKIHREEETESPVRILPGQLLSPANPTTATGCKPRDRMTRASMGLTCIPGG